ncbi:hypothetical protein DLJ53_07480 [Acuticoccus sediminis]|uniref:Uncharacterized protein n=1 Tax=Acuticoccus sediminis TaxID=2184697 RepID=A0A8B2P1E2_9HYPH|nr:hypothetical protein [Acuticoccus sediminis]RAI04275.1 hypothetical protein DLJ53_07480 [Acuticoccus sediminis]
MAVPREPTAEQLAAAALAEEIVRRAPQDIVFTMTFMGESRQRLLAFFEALIAREIEARGASLSDDLVRPFIDEHAARLRDFVMTGTALTRQYRLDEIERLLGDRTMITRVDLWDTLTDHILAACHQFQAQADEIPALLAALRRTRDGLGTR